MSLTIPKVVYIILGIILIWISINVTNCSTVSTDSARAFLVIFAFSMIFHDVLEASPWQSQLPVRGSASRVPVFQYPPSSMLMGDAGSSTWLLHRHPCHAVRHPFLYLLMAGVMIVDGGIGLVKVFLLVS